MGNKRTARRKEGDPPLIRICLEMDRAKMDFIKRIGTETDGSFYAFLIRLMRDYIETPPENEKDYSFYGEAIPQELYYSFREKQTERGRRGIMPTLKQLIDREIVSYFYKKTNPEGDDAPNEEEKT